MLELEDVILNVLRLAGPRGVGRTMLVKLVYFAELEHWRRCGAPLTGTPFRLHHYGAYAPEVAYTAEELTNTVDHSYFQGFFHWEHNYKLKAAADPPPVPEEIGRLLEETVEKYARMTAARVGELSKETEPVKAAETGRRLDLSIVAPRRPDVRVRSNRLASAAAAFDTSTRGRRSEIDARDAEEVRAWAPARQRAAQN